MVRRLVLMLVLLLLLLLPFLFLLLSLPNQPTQICDVTDKLNQMVALINRLQAEAPKKFMVYMSTCACVNYFGALLRAIKACSSLPVLSLHGKITQEVRKRED